MKMIGLIFSILLAVTNTFGQNEIIDFLNKNKYEVSPRNISNPLFDNAFYQSNYFLFGENHGSAEPQEIDLALLKHFNQKAGVNHYIAEIDFTKAWMLNNFLKDGDTKWLDKVFKSWKADTLQWANQELYNKFVNLSVYQKSLPEKQKITIVGIDVPQDYSLLHEHLGALTKNATFGKYQSYVDTLYSLTKNEISIKTLSRFSKRFLKMVENDTNFQKVLKGDYLAFCHLLTSFSSLNQPRDKVMYENFVSQLSLFKWNDKKMYGFIGLHHCLQTSYNNSEPFASFVKKNLEPGKKISSLIMLALDSETMLPYAGSIKQMMPKEYADKILSSHPSFSQTGRYIPFQLSNDSPMMVVEGISNLKSFSKPESVYLFKLSGTNSPFARTKELAEIKGIQSLQLTNPNNNTLDAFQYILLFRNSKAATPME